MNKKIIIAASLMLFFCFALSFKLKSLEAYAAVRTYDLDEAIDRAQTYNSSINLLKEKISLTEDKINESSGLDEEKMKKELRDLEYQLDQKKKDIEIEVTRLYHTILIKEKQVNLQEDVIDRLKGEYDIKMQQFKQGKATEIDLAAAEINRSEGEAKLKSLKNELQGLIMDLNIIMGDAPSNSLRLKNKSLPNSTIRIKDIDELADKMIDESPQIQSLIEEKDLALKDSDADSDTILNLEYDIEDEIARVKSRVYTGYNAILNKRDDVSIKELDYERLQKQLEAAKIKLDYGLISKIDYDKAKQDAEDALNSLLMSKLDYYVEIRKYKLFIEPAQ